MKIYNDCFPCILRGSLDAARLATDDETIHRKILATTMEKLGSARLHDPPPIIAQHTQRQIKEISGNKDPYKELKIKYNEFAKKILPELEAMFKNASDPFELAVRIAIAGNIIDFGAMSDKGEAVFLSNIQSTIKGEIQGDIAAFHERVQKAERILWLGDNTGEIVLDRLLLEQMDTGKVTYAVRGGAVLNDATMDDAIDAGLTKIVRVIDNGADIPGTVLPCCSEEFKNEFVNADLIISKGQGNFETLDREDKRIVFLFKVKCKVVAENSGFNEGDSVILMHS
jgi:damage-control phosphatase, subfamily I